MISLRTRRSSAAPAPGRPAGGVERLVAALLLWSGILSVTVVMVGLALYAADGRPRAADRSPALLAAPASGVPRAEVFTSLGAVIQGIRRRPVDPLALTTAGLLLLVLTPVLGVAAAIPAFARAGDRRYAAIAVVVLGLLVLSFVLAGTG